MNGKKGFFDIGAGQVVVYIILIMLVILFGVILKQILDGVYG